MLHHHFARLIDKSWKSGHTHTHTLRFLCGRQSQVNRHSTVQRISARSRENEMERGYAWFMLTIQVLRSKSASSPFCRGQGTGPPFVQGTCCSSFHMFWIFDFKYVSEPPTLIIVMVLRAAVLKPSLCGPVTFQSSHQTVPKSGFTHVGTCKHRLKASSLQIGDSSHSADWVSVYKTNRGIRAWKRKSVGKKWSMYVAASNLNESMLFLITLLGP